MLKKSILGLLLLLVGASPGYAALDMAAAADNADAQVVAALRARFGGENPPETGANQGELMLALAGLATDAATEAPQGDWKTEDYDALYALLQKYRDELRGMGFSQKQLEDELAALKLRARELQERLDKLQPKDGMKIHGYVENVFDTMMVSGPLGNAGTANVGKTLRYQHGILRTQLQLSVVRGIFSGEVEYYLQRVLADMYSCTTCIAAVNAINVEVRTPIVFQAGDLDAKLSPFTLWRNEDEEPFEPEPFASRRQELRDQLRLKPDALRMRGIHLSTDLVLVEAQKVDLDAYLFNLGIPGAGIYVRGNTAVLGGDTPAGQTLSAAYETFFGAWRARLPLRLLDVSYLGTITRDATDTAILVWGSGPFAGQRVRGFDSQVHSAELTLHMKDQGLSGRAEIAESFYSNPNLRLDGSTQYSTGTAATLAFAFRGRQFGVGLSARQVSEGFFSTPAQGRTIDAETLVLGPFLTENSLFNPNPSGVGPQYGGIGVPEPPETHFNRSIVPPQVIQGGVYRTFRIPYDVRINASSPYGLATPNRRGGRLDADMLVLDEGLKVMAMVDSATEISGQGALEPMAYLVYRAGTVLDLAPWLAWPISFNAGYTVSDMRNGDKVAFTSTMLDLGMGWRITKNMDFSVGARHLDYNGTLPYTGTADTNLLAFGYVAVDQAYNIGGLGLKWRMGDDVNMRITYSSTYFLDHLILNNGGPAWWGADQGFFQLNFVF